MGPETNLTFFLLANVTAEAMKVEPTQASLEKSLVGMSHDVCSKPGTPGNHYVANGFETHAVTLRLAPDKPLMEWGPVFAKMVTLVSFLDHLHQGQHSDVLAWRWAEANMGRKIHDQILHARHPAAALMSRFQTKPNQISHAICDMA